MERLTGTRGARAACSMVWVKVLLVGGGAAGQGGGGPSRHRTARKTGGNRKPWAGGNTCKPAASVPGRPGFTGMVGDAKVAPLVDSAGRTSRRTPLLIHCCCSCCSCPCRRRRTPPRLRLWPRLWSGWVRSWRTRRRRRRRSRRCCRARWGESRGGQGEQAAAVGLWVAWVVCVSRR